MRIKDRIINYISKAFNIQQAVFQPEFQTLFTSNKQDGKNSSWIWDCIDVWGNGLMKAKFDLYTRTSKGDLEEYEPAHPIKDLFARPNTFQDWEEILYNIAGHWALYGYSAFLKIRDGLNIVREILQIPPQFIKVISSDKLVDYYEIQYKSGSVRYDPSEIIYLKNPNPSDVINGRPVISKILNVAEVDAYQTAYQRAFYEQGGFLGQIFSTDLVLSNDAYDRVKVALQQNYGRLKQAYKTGLLEGGVKPTNVTHSIKEMDIRSQRELTRDEILAAFQVSKFQLGMGESINRATAIENQMRFASDVIMPKLTLLSKSLTRQLCLNEYGWDSFIIQAENISPRDLETDGAWYSIMTKSGAITPNEIRAYEDLDPLQLDGMDEPLALKNSAVINQPTTTTQNQNSN